MQPELPWNVAGIAPEAREAARASARREGLSVGEWLTRRILRALADGNAPQDDWWIPVANSNRHVPETNLPAQESSDMLARVSRSESETRSSWQNVEEQLKGLARRLEQTERSQSETGRAVSQTATEINIAAREQTQAVDQLGGHVISLNERMRRLEELAAGDGSKEAVKALHHGLSRLADQLAETAKRSAEQAAQLATGIESVAGKLAEDRAEGQASWHALEDRVAVLAANVGSIAGKLLESRDHAERQARAIEARLTASEQAIEEIEAARGHEDAEKTRLETALSHLAESLDLVTRRFAASEAQLSGSLARLEEQISGIDTQAGEDAVDARLQTVERTLADVEERIDRNERDSLRASARPSAAPVFDLPPFAENPSAAFPPASMPETASPTPKPAATDAVEETLGAAPFVNTDAIASAVRQHAAAAGAESFLAAARRSARAIPQAEQTQRGRFFSWVDPPAARNADEPARTRMILLIGLGLLIVAAAAASLVLSARFAAPVPSPQAAAPAKPHIAALVPPQKPAPAPTNPVAVAAPSASQTRDANLASNPPPTHRTSHARTRAASAQVRMIPPARSAAATARSARTTVSLSPQARLVTLANAGNAKAQEVLGLQYLDGDGVQINEAEAAKWLERAALQGEAVAAYRLGTLFERGQGVPADPAKAAQWYAVAAKAGNRKAMHNLAVAYAQGSGVQKDFISAAQWFARAAALGLADSQFNLAVLYERGMGVPQSLADAYKWYSIAAAQGDAESKTRIDALASQISSADKAAAEKAAADFHPETLDRAANSPPDMASVVGG
ncbi:MAG: hypothetical protein ACREHV_09575 [Rhizomicrobium sp.]